MYRHWQFIRRKEFEKFDYKRKQHDALKNPGLEGTVSDGIANNTFQENGEGGADKWWCR
jgi:hypothetical protein